MSDQDQNRVPPESEPDYDSMSLEELDRLIAGEKPPEPEESAPEPVENPEPDPEPEPQAAAAEPEPEKEPEPDTKDLLIQELEARVKHFESLAGRNAGELGFVKQQLRKLQEAQQRRPTEEDTFESEPEQERRPVQRREPTRDDVAAWAVSQAVSQALAEFGRQHPDAAELQEAIGAYLKQSGYDPKDILESDSPVEAAKQTLSVLEGAYWHAKAEVKAKARQEAETRRTAQIPQVEKAKRKAVISGAGAAPPPKPKPKAFEDMSVDELEAEIQRQLKAS